MTTISERLTPAPHLKLVVAGDGSCVQCNATERALDAAGVQFEQIYRETLTDDELAYLRGFGSRLPVGIDPSGDVWQGFRPDKIDQLKNVA